MLKPKSKIKLSQNLKLGVSGPASQGTIYKYGGVFFLILSLFLIKNIYSDLRAGATTAKLTTSANIEQKVLGAYSHNDPVQTVNYTIQKGDTLFTIAISQNVSWDVLATLNGLKAPYTLKAGETLKIPVIK